MALCGAPAEAAVTDESRLALIHPEGRDRGVATDRAALDPESSGRFQVEHRMCAPDRTEHWLLASLTLPRGRV